ncbi:centromere-associated protein E isoform X4 [Dicentrarchus labrax]|uniref:centromere-associated protein E isoform X4 n=1 Tax=Dicentrarchus labrax TaxID=13489 RepID=UPI0021F53485|nr:centromere-associated protein E isoform X4 [Dicentrarchus labrax]
MTEESAVKVCVRVRPLIEREESAVSENPEPVQLFWKADKKSIHQVDDGNSTKSFSFDRVFTAEETTNQLYQDIAKPLVVSSVEGYNGTIFAYGQTSSGKTFTMMGSDRIPGVIPLAVEDVFQTIKNCPKKEFLLRVSYMEIYNETVTDLLVDSWKRKPLEVRETINKNIYVADLTEELVTSPAQALSWIRKGEKNRHYGKTKMNQRSSRSHTIFRMILESRERSDPASGENADGAIIVSHLNLVDLAGSERASQTGAEGTRFKEGCNINRSLFTLGQVIKKLTDEGQKGFTNYRDSKLTRILQNSLGGNAKTVIICTITPVTLDETLSTLQFASTAKKMKNDPHVTEVSDDGALLKRYRNEIVDLKRRLNEVSSVTQTTATEKEVLSQLLQEKDQLQREQQDRIKNLTKLLVTSSNLVPVQRMPKRRVTWGGKMLRLARQSGCGPSDLSFAESFTRKRKADHSCLMELGEDDESFDSHWGIPDEPSDEMEMSQASVTVRSFGDSPKDFVSPDRMQELSGKLSHLELQLEMESQQKEEAMAKVDTLDGKVTELQLQLQTEAEQKHEALEKIQTAEKRAAELQLQLQLQTESQQKNEALENIQMTEQRAAELELQLQTEAQQKQEAAEKVEMLEFRVADLERQLEEQSHTQSATDEQMRREFAETIQLCETLASEKEMVVGERDYLKQELGMFIEQTESLEKEKAALAQELEERRELDEFKSLEEEFKKEHENELQKEISHLKKAVETSELQCLELQNKLETLSEDLKKKSDFAEELQSMSGKDLVQEVAKLRRSLDDAEGVSRDTKKEWAVLRSEHIALEEENVTLTANHEKLEAEVNSLRFQLETEKSRYRKMQSDLQKELNVAFDENTKLTTLLDGKVPKNLIDSVELERTVTSLSKELMASREAEEALRAQLEELASLQTLPDKVDHLMKQVCELTEKLCAVETHRNSLLSTQAQCQEEAQQLRDSLQTSQDEILKIQADLSAAALREEELSQQCADLTQQLDSLRLDLECSDAEKSQNMATIEETGLKLEESERHRTSLEEKVREVQQLMKGLEETLADSEVSRATEEEISKELQEQLNQLTEELQCVRAEKEQNAGAQSSAEEMEKLLSTVSSLTAERDQLKMDLEENVEMMIENQEELRTALEKSREQRERIKQLETAQTSKQDGPNDTSAQQEEPQTHIQTLTEELESVRAERDGLLSERTADSHSEETEKLLHRVTSLSEERDQLQETLEGLRQEKKQLEDKMETLQTEIWTLTEKLRSVEAERDGLLSERTAESHSEETEKLLSRVTSLSEERDQLQEILEGLRQEKKQLQAELEDRMEMVAQAQSGFNQPEILTSELQAHDEKVTQLQQEVEQLQATLQTISEQKSQLEDELKSNMDMATETQSLLHTLHQQLQEQNQRNIDLESLSQERQAQLEQQFAETQDLLHSLQEELQEQKQKNSDHMKLCEQKESDLEQQTKTLSEQLESAQAERDALLCEKETGCQSSTEEMQKLLSRVTSLSEERDQLQETLEGLRQEKKQLQAELEDKMEMIQCDFQQQLSAEPQSLKEEQEAQQVVQIQQLEEHLDKTKEELNQMKSDLQENVELMIENQEELRVSQEKIRVLQDEINMLRSQKAELESRPSNGSDAENTLQSQELQNQIHRLTEELESVRAERDGLLSERTAETEKLLHRVKSLSEERDQLQDTLEGLRQEKKLLRAELEDKMETLQTEMWTLSEKLRSIEAERDGLLSEKETNSQRSTEEMEKLVSRVTSLSEEREQLQEKLEGLRQEKKQLQAELEDRMEMVSAIQEKLNVQQEGERGEREAKLQQQVQQLEEQLQMFRKRETQAEAAADTSQQLLSEANTTISALKEQLSTLDQNTSGVTETASSRLQVSTGQLQESFRRFQHLIDTCSKYNSSVLDKALRGQSSLKQPLLTSLPKPTMNAYSNVCKLGLKTVQSLGNITEHLQARAQGYRNLFEELVKKDLAIFEERRLQDVLLCRVQAPSYSVKEEDFHTMWEHRLTELLEKRQLYLQKMATVLEKLWANIASFPSELSSEIRERERFKEQLGAVLDNQPISFSRLDSILSCELDRRSAMVHSRKMILQGIVEEQNGLCEELKLLEAQADSQHQGERGNSSTLLQALEGAPLKTELSLLKDNQQLVLQLQQTEEKVKALSVQNEQLEHDQIKANNRVSNHKQATQLLQTELQDSRAQVEEKDGMIQTLRSKLRESEKNASPSAVEMEKLQTKLFKMEVELSSASAKHQQEIQSLNTLVSEKEDSLRKLKETLRKLQQQGDDSFLQGEDLHARLTNPRGLVIRSSIVLEKTKLEEEVKQLQLKITELEGLVSSQQAEIGKWKARAIKLKVKTKAEVDKPSPPCTPTKRGLATTSDSSTILSSPKKFLVTPRKVLDSQGNVLDSPRKLLDSPKVPRLDSPKSRFFDVAVSSEVLSRTRPKQFFDNSNLGTIPEVSQVPDTADAEEDEAVGAQNKEEWWPTSPKQEDMCKSQ